jgi:UDP-N-acetylglucosamine 4-epimerase
LFIKSALTNTSPIINGDGTITRDFTPVTNVVQINCNGLLFPLDEGKHYVLNVACGQTTDLNKIWSTIKKLTNTLVDSIHGPNRKGDILFSLADISLAKEILKYNPEIDLEKQMHSTIDDYKSRFFN